MIQYGANDQVVYYGGAETEQPIVAAGWYSDAYVAFRPKYVFSIGGLLADSYIDFSGNSRNAAIGNAPVLGANGWDFDGVANYLRIPGAVSLTTNWTVVATVSSLAALANNSYLFGVYDGSRFYYVREGNAGVNVRFTNGNEILHASVAVSGVAMNASKAYINGSPIAGAFTGFAGTNVLEFYIGALNLSGSASLFEKYKLSAFGLWSSSLSDAQILSKHNEMISTG